jgi:putative membrane protein
MRTALVLWACLAVYASARVCQLFADRLPILLIVLLHVVPPAVFALVHGATRYGWRGILAFAGLCLGVGALSESLSLRTGFPFGHYYFTDVMGPKILDLPPLLVLAYLGMGYLAWTLALLIAGARNVLLPFVAAFAMLAWDLSMEPDWATVDRAWIWKQGGPYFGVPLSNFFGWFLTAYAFYQLFAVYCRARSNASKIQAKSYWRIAILFYAVSACGNLLLPRQPMAPAIVADATGRAWATAEILRACSLMSLLIMLPLALLAWRRVPPR